MMAGHRIDSLDQEFDDHPSLSASLEDFEHNETRSPLFGLPSQHSGFKSEESEADVESTSEGPWSPPAWKKQNAAGGWYRHQPYPSDNRNLKPRLSNSRSKDTSPQYESAREEEEDITIPANIPLPKGSLSPVKEQSPSPPPRPKRDCDAEHIPEKAEGSSSMLENPNNYIRFSVRADVQQRTALIEDMLSCIRIQIRHINKSWSSLSTSFVLLILIYSLIHLLTHTPDPPPVPDLVKVAGLARSFEPLIFYSEHGIAQVSDLQETSVAVWDLGESVRFANMTSAPLITAELDDLSESLKTLGLELSRFFTNVDGDIDGILIVMEWAKRELSALSALPTTSLSAAFTNIHTLLSHLGVLENRSTGLPTALGTLFTDIFGTTGSQRRHQTLQRTFNELLAVLEDSINSELTYSTSLITLFESIDRQFLNLQRMVIRESDTQERLEGEFLSSMWVRIMGANASLLRKYEKNKELLSSVRSKTTSNKILLVEHNGKLINLKGNLENLRRKLFSPLVRRENGSTIGIEEQIRGLEGTYNHLGQVREKQKGRVQEILYGVKSRRTTLEKEEGLGIDGR